MGRVGVRQRHSLTYFLGRSLSYRYPPTLQRLRRAALSGHRRGRGRGAAADAKNPPPLPAMLKETTPTMKIVYSYLEPYDRVR